MAEVTGRKGGSTDPGRRPFGGRSISALLSEIARAPEVDIGMAAARLRPGVVVEGRFEIVREVGRGGFGVVHEARDLSLGRTVAFKVVSSAVNGAMREERLLREAAAAARLSHPNIVQLHDLGHSEYGPYLVLEMLRGRTLAERLEGGPLPVREAVHMARDVAAALAHAHSAGVIHRDLNPRNVFVDEEGHAKVLDFGLARAFGQRGVQGGTAGYMAPEQWRGAPEDERTDVFALGVLTFQMLMGELPFPGETGSRDARGPPILEVPEVPALGPLVQRMLARDPVDRPRDAAAVAREIDEIVEPLAPASGTTIAERPRARRRSILPRAAGTIFAIAAGAVVGAFLHERTVHASGVAHPGRTTVVVADPLNRTGNPDLDAVSPLLATALEPSRALEVPGRLRLLDLVAQDALGTPGKVEPAAAREIARRLGAQLVLVPEVRRIGSELVLQVRGLDPGRLDPLFVVEERAPATERMEAIPDLVDRIAGAVRQALRDGGGAEGGGKASAVTQNLEAYRHYLLGQQFANETFDIPSAIAEYKAAIAADPGFAMPHLEMAILAGWHDAPDEDQRTHMAAASKNAGKLPDKERRLILGYSAFVEQRYPEATRILDALALDYPLDKQVLYLAGEAYWHGDTPAGFARAASFFRSALDLDPAYLVAYLHLFEWLDRFGPKGEALARAERAAKLRPSAEGQAMVARALGAADRWPEALAVARSASALSGGEHFESVYAQAEVLFGAGEHAEAERMLRRWLVPNVSPGHRRVAAEVLAPLLALKGRAREGREIFLAVTPAEGGNQYAAWDAEMLAYLALAGGNTAAARRSLETRRPPAPGEDLRADHGAWLAAWLGMDDEAAARALVLKPGSISERQYVAVRALRDGDPTDAADVLADVARRSPDVEPQFLLGLALSRSGRHAEALQAFEAVCARHAILAQAAVHVFRPWADLLAAESLARLGRRDEARARVRAWLAGWSDADPGLPLLAQARELDRRLAGD